MKTYRLTLRQYKAVLSVLVLAIGFGAMPVQAQMSAASERPQRSTVTMTLLEEGMPSTPVITNISAVDFEQLTRKQWKQLRRELITTLRTADDAAWERAALNVLYLSIYYRDRVDFERASTPLLEAYILDRDEQHRILALAAMHAIGDHDTMAHLAQRVRLEASPRMRRLTTAAVVDYFSPETPVKMGPARQIGSSL